MDKDETQLFLHQTSYNIFGSRHAVSLQSNAVCQASLAVLLLPIRFALWVSGVSCSVKSNQALYRFPDYSSTNPVKSGKQNKHGEKKKKIKANQTQPNPTSFATRPTRVRILDQQLRGDGSTAHP